MQSANQSTLDPELAQAIDALMEPTCQPDAPGAAVIVARDGTVVFRKGNGLAHLELGVPITPDMVFRLGSITKQFTAIAILMLMEQGKLALADPITTFLPDYPTHGYTITVEHLLTHTSGMKSYTEMSEWLPLWRTDLTLAELIGLFKDQPLEFPPGERWAYNNLACVLLGAIIEQVSGQTYEQFLDQHIFAPLGMQHSCYDRTSRIIPGRVAGYAKAADGYENAAYLSMTQPYAAGALVSSVDDLARWDAALASNTLMQPATLQRAWTPAVLTNGTSTGYGYGWGITSYEGHRMVEHGGGIHGFLTYAIHLPKDQTFVAVVMNPTGDEPEPEQLAVQIAAAAIGKPYREPVPITLTAEALAAYVGVYQINDQEAQLVTRDGEHLFTQRTGGSQEEIFPHSATEFVVKHPFRRLTFVKDAAGAVMHMEVYERSGPVEIATTTDHPLPHERQAVSLDPALAAHYVGEYELAPGVSITVRQEADALILIQARGQHKVELLPESQRRFLLTGRDAQVEFVQDESGAVTGVAFYEGPKQLPGTKIA